MSVSTKVCRDCRVDRPIGDFYVNKQRGKTYLWGNCKFCWADATLEKRAAIKDEGFEALGGECACCGEVGRMFLTLDHVQGRSPGDRRTGNNAWLAAKREGWPKAKYQILCYNCNCAKGVYGVCPHVESLSK